MQQSKFSLTPPLVDFLGNHASYGFKDKSSMVRLALQKLKKELELQALRQSADLYAEVYETDEELQEITDSAMPEWPI